MLGLKDNVSLLSTLHICLYNESVIIPHSPFKLVERNDQVVVWLCQFEIVLQLCTLHQA